MASLTSKVPQVSQVRRLRQRPTATSFAKPTSIKSELAAFHDAHFGAAALAYFDTKFSPHTTKPNDTLELENEVCEDDELGYYADGVKRTLTDEQIAIFRHSEEESIRREQAKADKSKAAGKTTDKPALVLSEDEGEVEDDGVDKTEIAEEPKMKKKRKWQSGKSRSQPRPDLRKRTWDIVDSGLGSLEYDESTSEPTPANNLPPRRQIFYDD